MRNVIIKNHEKSGGEKDNICPLCGGKINLEENIVIDSPQDPDVCFASCPECGGSIVVSTLYNFFGSATMAIATDLSAEDLLKFSKSEEISSDEILDLYTLAKEMANVQEG